MSGLLDVTVGEFRVMCLGTARLNPQILEAAVAVGGSVVPGDLVVVGACRGGKRAVYVVHGHDRRQLAEVFAPTGALIGTPDEIAPLLERTRARLVGEFDLGEQGGGGC